MFPDTVALCKKCKGILSKQNGPTATCIICGYQNRRFVYYPVKDALSKKSLYYARWAEKILGNRFSSIVQSFSDDGVILRCVGKKAGGGSPRFWRLPKYIGKKRVQKCCSTLIMLHRQQLPIPWEQFSKLVNLYQKQNTLSSKRIAYYDVDYFQRPNAKAAPKK